MTDLFSYVDTEDAPVAQPAVQSVAELSYKLKQFVEGEFGRVSIEGEIGTCSFASSGHVYLTLKDQKTTATIDATVWRSRTVNRDYLTQGTLLVAHGRVTTFPQRSRYQLDIERIEPAGLGRLLQLLEERKQRLAEEGLFLAERKRPIPFLPMRIGIVTSPTGAVIEDMLHRIDARCPRHVMLWPVPVQGLGADAKIVEAIEGFNRLPMAERPDVLIVARGGGSLEDLMAFNEENVVRAVAASEIPVVSGVGHEPDTTLCDYAADLRVPTPTAAAEAVTPVREDLLFTLTTLQQRLTRAVLQQVNEKQRFLDVLQQGLPRPQQLLEQAYAHVASVEERLGAAWKYRWHDWQNNVKHVERVLKNLAPEAVLNRGFVYITGENGHVLSSVKAPAQKATLHFKDGVRDINL